MITYKYSFFAKFLYRYANIVITLLLLIYAIFALLITFQKWYFVFVFLVNVLIIFYVNRFYLRNYRLFPFKIEADNSRLVCSNFFLSKQVLEIELKNIGKIWGGFISGWQTKPIYIFDKTTKKTIGIYVFSPSFKSLMKNILENIPEDVYQEILVNMKQIETEIKNPGKPGH